METRHMTQCCVFSYRNQNILTGIIRRSCMRREKPTKKYPQKRFLKHLFEKNFFSKIAKLEMKSSRVEKNTKWNLMKWLFSLRLLLLLSLITWRDINHDRRKKCGFYSSSSFSKDDYTRRLRAMPQLHIRNRIIGNNFFYLFEWYQREEKWEFVELTTKGKTSMPSWEVFSWLVCVKKLLVLWLD